MTTRDALRLLQAEIVQVVGCTEPAAIAYALRTLVRHTQPRKWREIRGITSSSTLHRSPETRSR